MKKVKIGLVLLVLMSVLVQGLYIVPAGAVGEPRYMIFGTWTNATGWDYNAFKTLVDTADSVGFNAVKVHIPWYLLETTPDVYDFTVFDQQVDYVVNTLGLKVAITIDLTRMSTTDGVIPSTDFQVDSSGNLPTSFRKAFSFSSDTAVDKAANIVKLVTSHYNTNYSSSMLFYESTFSGYCETEYFPVTSAIYDYSGCAIDKYRLWLAKKYSSISELNTEWGTSYSDFINIQPAGDFNGAAGLSWYQFRQESLKTTSDKMIDVGHSVSSSIKMAVRFGSVWDSWLQKRASAGFANLCQKADIVFVDDGPNYNHPFSMDYLRSTLPGKQIGNEIDHPNSADNTTYYNQAAQSYDHGVAYMTVGNWVDPAVLSSRGQLFLDISNNYLSGTVPAGDPNRKHIHISTYDLLMNGFAFYQDIYNYLSSNGSLWVDCIAEDNISFNTKGSIVQSVTASTGFSSTQGANQWYYQELNGSTYSNMTYDSANTRWKGSQLNVLVANFWQYPDTYDSVRKWVSNMSGTISVSGVAKKTATGGDGVIVTIKKNNTTIWGPVKIDGSNTTGIDFNIETSIANGDALYFIVNKNGDNSYDHTTFNPTISLISSPKYSWTASTDFSSTQGTNQWCYQEWNGNNYANMTYDSANTRWKGTQNFVLVGNNYQHPDTYDSVRKWVAVNPGKVTLTGNPKKVASGGDGVVVKIMKNNSVLWGPYTISGTDTTGLNYNITTSVVNGDSLYFVVNKNVTNTSDSTSWNPSIGFTNSVPSSWLASTGFSSTQGTNGWHYKELNGTDYVNMTWDTANNRWKGSQTFVLVGSNFQHPDVNDSVRCWVASDAGRISVTGTAKKSAAGGDGVYVKIMKNSTDLLPQMTVAQGDTSGVKFYTDCDVNVGDVIYFKVNKIGTNTSDSTLLDPKITYISIK